MGLYGYLWLVGASRVLTLLRPAGFCACYFPPDPCRAFTRSAGLGILPTALPPFASVAVLEVYSSNDSSPLVRLVYNGAVLSVRS